MSGSRTKKIRAAFEGKNGFTGAQRQDDLYKYYWRKFKKGLKKNG